MSSNTKLKKKKPVSVTLWASLIFALITFAVGYIIPSVFMLDQRIESKNEEIEVLKQEVQDRESEISSLEGSIKEKDSANVILGEKIAEHLQTIESLNAKISELESDVDFAAQVAMSQETASAENRITSAVSRLSSGEQLVIMLILFVLLIFIVSITCWVLAATKGAPASEENKKKKKKEKKKKKSAESESKASEKSENSEEPELEKPDNANGELTKSDESPVSEEAAPETEEPEENSEPMLDSVNGAIALLYEGKLEDAMESLGGFKFGITNFDEVLSHKASGKSFGGSENGDFVAFMSENGRTLYIIPRYMTLSDSALSLRGVTDLFEIKDKDEKPVPRGTVKIKVVEKPAVFRFGDGGWAISSMGKITAEIEEVHVK